MVAVVTSQQGPSPANQTEPLNPISTNVTTTVKVTDEPIKPTPPTIPATTPTTLATTPISATLITTRIIPTYRIIMPNTGDDGFRRILTSPLSPLHVVPTIYMPPHISPPPLSPTIYMPPHISPPPTLPPPTLPPPTLPPPTLPPPTLPPPTLPPPTLPPPTSPAPIYVDVIANRGRITSITHSNGVEVPIVVEDHVYTPAVSILCPRSPTPALEAPATSPAAPLSTCVLNPTSTVSIVKPTTCVPNPTSTVSILKPTLAGSSILGPASVNVRRRRHSRRLLMDTHIFQIPDLIGKKCIHKVTMFTIAESRALLMTSHLSCAR